MRKRNENRLKDFGANGMDRYIRRGKGMAAIVAVMAVVAALLLCGPVYAYTIGATLTGDPRVENPDSLIVDVTIVVDDATPNVASWTVDINSPLHPNAKSTGFYFNLLSDGKFSSSNVTFGNFGALFSNWVSVIPATNVPGSGSMNFNFGVKAGTGRPQNLTDSPALTFDMTLTAGVFTINDFLNALPSSSSNTTLGSGQLGMHLQSLNTAVGNATTDSGFALGSYQVVPVPAAAWLLGTGLLGLIGIGRRWRKR